MIPFEYLEHTADVKFRAYGETPEEMLSNAAAALFKTMVDPATVQILETWKVELEAPVLEDLAYKWLSEIVFLFETESAVFATFEVRSGKTGPGSCRQKSAARGWTSRDMPSRTRSKPSPCTSFRSRRTITGAFR